MENMKVNRSAGDVCAARRQRIAVVAIVLVVLTGAVTALSQVPHSFDASTPAKASEVNENFKYLYENLVPPGTITAYGGETPPDGWLLCNGQLLNRTTYARLYSAIGTAWGNTNSSNFRVPDLRGQFMRGAHGPSDGNRAVANFQADTYASHGHGVTDPGHTHSGFHDSASGAAVDGSRPHALFYGDYGNNYSTYSSTTSISVNASGGSETRPDNYAVNFIIRHGN